MAASSSSSTSFVRKCFKYDVFISFRGVDTCKSFVAYLYEALKQKGICSYKDEGRIMRGNKISDDLIGAIEDSRFYIVIFSKNYASSSWCLNELVKIMECYKMMGHFVYPVYYDVEPSEVRKQTGAVGEAFATHNNNKEEVAGRWREALKEAADLPGWDLWAMTSGDEAKLIDIIIKNIFSKLHSFRQSSYDGTLVGMETRLQDLESSLDIGVKDVRMIGIKGMGGAGKTTLARAIFDRFSIHFEAVSFVENVREVSKSSASGLKKLQIQLFRDVFNDKNITISSVYDGKNIMKKFMLRKKVLIVVDDVDHIDQLQALAGEPNWFKPGTRIIITTRDEQILIAHRVQAIRDVNLLTDLEGITLFSMYAFGVPVPIQEYEKPSRMVVAYAAGLPLTIKVLGSYLSFIDKCEWIDALERLKTGPPSVIRENLELSYFGLEEDQKEIFLYVACLLKGWKKTKSIRLLESNGFRAASGLRVLQQRSLITIDDDQVLGMHYQIEEMGKSIVRRLHPGNPKRYSRLSVREEIEDISASDLDTDVTRAVVVDTPVNLSSEIVTTGFGTMKKLRALHLVSDIPSMASSLTSSNQKRFKYDVFISFRGEDTCKNFVGHLHHALQQKGIETYKYEEKVEKEDNMDNELIKSIEESQFLIVVFSKNYASSSWCLDELVKIMECWKMTEHYVYPVFYDVKPIEVRKQSGAVGEAFARHNNKQEAGKWREALKLATNLSGFELKTTVDGDECKLIQVIVDEIFQKLCSSNHSDDGRLVGMENRIKDVESLLETGSVDVRMIGIKGMGGAGKTTLARTIFDRLSSQFEGKSFLDNVREESMASHGLKNLQKQILSDVFYNKGIALSGVYDGKCVMKKMMRSRKILLVLDDVDHIDQLEALAGELDWFKPGSRVIITTRDERVLTSYKVEWIYDVKLLSDEESLCLLSRFAFGRDLPIEGYKELSLQVVHYAAGLPLTVRVLGSFLCGKCELEWLDALKRLEAIPLKETLDRLELSYINLDDDLKEIFLDIACSMKRLRKDDAVRMLESQGYHANIALKILETRSLLTFRNQRLQMHDHIEEMGKNIVRRVHPDEFNRHSRLWIHKEIESILSHDLDTKAAEFIRMEPVKISPQIIMEGLGELKELRALRLYTEDDDTLCSDWTFDQVRQYFPNSLRCLSWEGYPFSCLPQTFRADELVLLEMCNSRIEQLWEGGETKVLEKLRFLDLSYTKMMTLDLGTTPNLERLDLIECHGLVEVHAPVGSLKRLAHLNLVGCSSFRSFQFINQLESHEVFSFSKLDMIVKPSGEYPKYSNDNLQLLLFTCSYYEEAPLPNGNPPKFVSLNLKPCTKLESVSETICCLQHLRELSINGCIPEVPNDIFRLEILENLSLVSTCITHLPDSICMLKRLKSLNLELCELKKLPEGLDQLECLEKLILTKCKSLKDIPNSICKIIHLVYLHLPFCSLVEKLPKELGSLKCLKELNVDRTGIRQLLQCTSLMKGLRIIGSESVLQSFGSASGIQTSECGTFFYIQQ